MSRARSRAILRQRRSSALSLTFAPPPLRLLSSTRSPTFAATMAPRALAPAFAMSMYATRLLIAVRKTSPGVRSVALLDGARPAHDICISEPFDVALGRRAGASHAREGPRRE